MVEFLIGMVKPWRRLSKCGWVFLTQHVPGDLQYLPAEFRSNPDQTQLSVIIKCS